MTKDLISKIIKGCGWSFDCSGGGQPYRFKKGNFYLLFNCKDSHDLSTAYNVSLTILIILEELEYKQILNSEMPKDIIGLKGLIQYYTDLIKN